MKDMPTPFLLVLMLSNVICSKSNDVIDVNLLNYEHVASIT